MNYLDKQIHRHRKYIEVTRDWEEERKGGGWLLFNRSGACVWGNEKLLHDIINVNNVTEWYNEPWLKWQILYTHTYSHSEKKVQKRVYHKLSLVFLFV